MPKITKEKKAELKARIRSILVRIPNANKYVLAENIGVSHNYALKLKNEILDQNARRIDKQVIKKEVAKMEMTFNEIETECWRIISGKQKQEIKDKEGNLLHTLETSNENKDIIQALKTLLDAKKKLFEIKFDAGLFSRKLGEINLKTGEFIKMLKMGKQHARRKKDEDNSKS